MPTQTPDRFEARLDEMMARLQACQKEKQVKSCSTCEQLIGCETRHNYVQAVYDSMSKGETGGFEF
jgi:hypothetical protein